MRHHYIPQFYLKRWAALIDRRLCEFSRPFRDVVPSRKHPKATAFIDDLYAIPGVPEERRHLLEQRLFARVDQEAFNISRRMLEGRVIPQAASERSAWSRFLLSLKERSPERLRSLRQTYQRLLSKELARAESTYNDRRLPTDPPTFREFMEHVERTEYVAKMSMLAMRLAIDLEDVGRFIINMTWGLHFRDSNNHRILTSDRPLIMTDGLLRNDSHIVLPLSSNCLFIAARNERVITKIKCLDDEFITRANEHVVRSAVRYVYSVDDAELRFVEKRLTRPRT